MQVFRISVLHLIILLHVMALIQVNLFNFINIVRFTKYARLKVPYDNCSMLSYCSNTLSTWAVRDFRNRTAVRSTHSKQTTLFIFPYLKNSKMLFKIKYITFMNI